MTEQITKFKEILKDGVVEFTYSKIDGEIRPAKGTRCFDANQYHPCEFAYIQYVF